MYLLLTRLRLLPPARVQSPFPFAINCSLSNCEPVVGAWTTDDALLIQNITDKYVTLCIKLYPNFALIV